MELPEGCPSPSVSQNLSFSCFMPPRLELFNVFNPLTTELYFLGVLFRLVIPFFISVSAAS